MLFVGFYSRVLRSNMLDVMNEDYVRTARAKGLSERQIRVKHVLRNSMIPVITLFGLDFGAVVGGGVILTETVFNLNGVGLYAGAGDRQPGPPPVDGRHDVRRILHRAVQHRRRRALRVPRPTHPVGGGGIRVILSSRPHRPLRHRRWHRARGRRASRSTWPQVKSWPSSANPARARALPRRPCLGSPGRPTRRSRGASGSTVKTSCGSTISNCGPSAASASR